MDNPQVNTTTTNPRTCHLGERNLRNRLAKDGLVIGLDYDVSKNIDFCEPCVSGKIHRSAFPGTGRERAKEPLGLIHSDVCGKINSLVVRTRWWCELAGGADDIHRSLCLDLCLQHSNSGNRWLKIRLVTK